MRMSSKCSLNRKDAPSRSCTFGTPVGAVVDDFWVKATTSLHKALAARNRANYVLDDTPGFQREKTSESRAFVLHHVSPYRLQQHLKP